jgi:hypothetical protein
MPCTPTSVVIPTPVGPSGPATPGFGVPFSLPLSNVSPFPSGFPEDLLSLFSQLEFLVPPGALQPNLHPNFSKDVFDSILHMLDQFMPFLMLYKFFLPILNIIICIIEVLCALINPFALISAINRLFNQCIPQFLNMFPVFAIVIMLISLLLIILALIEYIAAQIVKMVQVLLRNITALNNAFQNGDASGVMAIALKLGSLLCIFQNLFVLFSIFNIIIEVVKDILRLAFAIPPCQNGGSGDTNSCCTPDTCPTIVKNQYTRNTGTFKYFGAIGGTSSLGAFPVTFSFRNEMWQLYDLDQNQSQAFSNIYDAYDITDTTNKPVFFPSGVTYPLGSDIKQVPYLINLRVFYVPADWGRTGASRYVRFDNCIVTTVPTPNLIEADNSLQGVKNAVAVLVGGTGYEDDDVTPLQAYAPDGVTPISGTATLNNFWHTPAVSGNTYVKPNINDGYTSMDVEYTFMPNIAPLIKSGLVTLGCAPDVAFSKDFVSNVVASNVGLQTQQLNSLVNSSGFPDPNAAQQCMLNAVASLRTNMTSQGVAQFQATVTQCLGVLQTATNNALNSLIGIGVSPCNSTFTLSPAIQFTDQPINVSVSLNESNGLSLTTGLSPGVAANVAMGLTGLASFGQVSNFTYDGYQYFNAQITSTTAGSGQISVSFNNNIFCTNTFTPPNHSLQAETYQFIYTPSSSTVSGGTDGKPRRDAGDVVRDDRTEH